MAGSGSSQSTKADCPMINLEGVIINSGYCSGTNNPKMIEVIKKSDPEPFRGTDKLYNVRVDQVDRPITKYTIGRMQPNAGSSNVIGTRKSFNAGMESFNAGRVTDLWKIPGNSFYNPNFDNRKMTGQLLLNLILDSLRSKRTFVDYEDRSLQQHGNAGTQFSFNVLDKESYIDMKGATINSGYCSGYHNDPGIHYPNHVSDCKGTDESFNAKSGGKILLKRAHVCSGAYAGGHKGAPGISAAKNKK